MGNACLSTKHQGVDVGKSEKNTKQNMGKSDKIKKKYESKYDRYKDENDKLKFLKNPITRPAGYVDDSNNNANDDMPSHSLATASKLAALDPKERASENGNDFNLGHTANLKSSDSGEFKKDKIHVDFGNMDDNVTDQGKEKEDVFDSHSQNDSNNYQSRDSLSFRPNNMLLKTNNQKSTDVPMSFGIGVLGPAKTAYELDHDM